MGMLFLKYMEGKMDKEKIYNRIDADEELTDAEK